ncbi:MAG: hypothetical protein H0X43_12095 [Nitrosospira sp.]|nr:hypothetical protein [Nitrosospira sp.]
MPGIELHADFDRNGRLTGNAAERAARLDWLGAVVVANLDRDQRALPARVSSGGTPDADYDIATAFPRDDELLPLEIRVPTGALGTGDRLVIRCSGVIVPHRPGDPAVFELPQVPASGALKLTLQVRTIAGASFGRLSNLDLSYRMDTREETRFELGLLRVDASNNAHVEDTGRFSVAPVILDDCLTTATRMYIVSKPDNRPSVEDVRRALAAASVPLVEVPVNLTGGDTWLQDQYQHAMMEGADRARQIILHLPRLRHENSNETVTDNLEDFVRTHFRSRDIAVFGNLWDRIISVNTSDGGVLRLDFRRIGDWIASIGRILRVSAQLDRFGALADPQWAPAPDDDWVTILRNLGRKLTRLKETIDRAATDGEPERALLLRGLKDAAEQLVREARADHGTAGSGDSLSVHTLVAAQTVSLPADTAQRLFMRGNQMHDSANYGGNLESTPPVIGAPLGKILLGNFIFPDGGELMDPDLLRLLAKQRKQPIVEINTAWLKVGHVDEMMAVVPHPTSGFSILHASSRAAMTLLREAELRYRGGLPIHHPDRINTPSRPSGVMPRLMTDGTSPVTRLFRGKAWRHVHPPARPGRVSQSQDPPSIYMQLASEFGGSGRFNVHRIGFVPGEGADRRYPADITPSEIIYCEREVNGESVNDGIDTSMLEPSRQILAQELGVPVLPVPVLWDRVEHLGLFNAAPWQQPTAAFSPNMANLQVVNGHLLVPKPYGPRMYRTDAVFVVRTAMRQLGMPGTIRDRVGQRLIARRRMTREQYWVEAVDPAIVYSSSGLIRTSYGGMRTAQDVIDAFRDSFPGSDAAERERRIIRPNERHFDSHGYLRKDFTRLAIDDGMVDLFELFTAAVADELGVQIHFVDSWYYHTGDGEIHCGTNVLRRPRRLNSWDAPDTEFRSRTIIFDEDVAESVGAEQQ